MLEEQKMLFCLEQRTGICPSPTYSHLGSRAKRLAIVRFQPHSCLHHLQSSSAKPPYPFVPEKLFALRDRRRSARTSHHNLYESSLESSTGCIKQVEARRHCRSRLHRPRTRSGLVPSNSRFGNNRFRTGLRCTVSLSRILRFIVLGHETVKKYIRRPACPVFPASCVP